MSNEGRSNDHRNLKPPRARLKKTTGRITIQPRRRVHFTTLENREEERRWIPASTDTAEKGGHNAQKENEESEGNQKKGSDADANNNSSAKDKANNEVGGHLRKDVRDDRDERDELPNKKKGLANMG